MTIALSIMVNDGLVLATDSASTVIVSGDDGAPRQVSTVYNNASKVFQICKDLPIGAITWGSGSIGVASISTLMKDLRAELAARSVVRSRHDTVKGMASRLSRFLHQRCKAAGDAYPDTDLGMLVSGYSRKASRPEQYLVNISESKAQPLHTISDGTERSMLFWQGEPEAISRLVRGYAPALPDVLTSNLGVPNEQIPDGTVD